MVLVLPGWMQDPLPGMIRSTCLLGSGLGPPLLPTCPPGPVLCRVSGSRGRAGAAGKDGEEEGNGLQRDRRKKNGDFCRSLHPPDAHHNLPPKGICTVLPVPTSGGSRTCAVRLASNPCCSPRWEKPALTPEQPAEVMRLPSKPRTEKTLLVLPTNPSYKAGCVRELLIRTDAKFADHFPSCITTHSPPCPRG